MSAPSNSGKKRPASPLPKSEEQQSKHSKSSAQIAPSDDTDVEMKPVSDNSHVGASPSSVSLSPSCPRTSRSMAPLAAASSAAVSSSSMTAAEEESKSCSDSESDAEDEEDDDSSQRIAEQAKRLISELIDNLNDHELIATGLDVTQVRRLLKQLIEDRKKQKYLIGFVSDTGVGKSFLINLILLLTEQPQAIYESRRIRARGAPLEYLNHSDFVTRKQARATVQRLEANSMKHGQLRKLLPEHRKDCEDKLIAACRMRGLTSQGNINPWLLPSESNPDATTTVVVRIRFGRTYHLVIEYADEQQLKETAFRYVELARQARLDNESETDEVMALRRQYEQLTGINPRRLIFNPSAAASANSVEAPRSIDEIKLHPDVLALAGTVSVFVGLGAGNSESLLLDRLYLQEHLYATMRDARRSAAITHCTLYVPSTILEGGCELQDIPGTSDPFREATIREAMTESDLLMVLLPKCISFATGIRTTLLASGSVQRSLKERTNHVHFIYYNEKETGFGIWNRDEQSVAKQQRNMTTFQEETVDWLERVVRDMTCGDIIANEELMSVISNDNVPIYSLQPLSFVSLAFSQGHNVFEKGDFHPRDALRRLMEATNVPRLMGAIGFVQHIQAARDLRRICQVSDSQISQSDASSASSSLSENGSTSSASVPAAAASSQIPSSAGCVHRLLEDLSSRINGMTRLAGKQTALIKEKCSGFLGRSKTAKLRFGQLIADANIPTNIMDAQRSEYKNYLDYWNEFARTELFVSKALDASIAAAEENLDSGKGKLKFGNFAVCLHENGGGNIPPLRLRSLLFDDYWSNHPLDFTQLISLALDILRDRFTTEVDNSLNQLLDALFKNNESLKSSSLIQPVVSAARSGLLQRINNLVDSFSRGPIASRLDGPRLSGAFDRACSRSLKAFLSKNYARWMKLGRTGEDNRVEVFLAEMKAHIPDLVKNAFDEFSHDVFARLRERLEDTLQRVYQKDGKKVSVMQTAVIALLTEVQNMPDEKDLVKAKEKLEDLTTFLKEWKKNALSCAQAALDRSVFDSPPDLCELQDTMLQWVQRKLVDYECVKLILPPTGKQWIPVNELFKQARGGVTSNILQKKYTKGTEILLKLLTKLATLEIRPSSVDNPMSLSRTGLEGHLGRLNDTPFGQMVLNAGLEVADVPHDGNCLFTALEHQLHWGGNHHGRRVFSTADEASEFCVPNAIALRGMLVGVLARQNVTPDLQRQFETNYTAGVRFDDYLTTIRKDGAWGGTPEIQAFADHFVVNIQIWAANSTQPYLICPTSARSMRDLPVINLGYVNAEGKSQGPLNHFVSLVPRLNMPAHQRQQLFWTPRTQNGKTKPSR